MFFLQPWLFEVGSIGSREGREAVVAAVGFVEA